MNAYLTITAAMSLSFLAQAIAVRGYVLGLLLVSYWPPALKVVAAVILWLVFACIVVLPLLAALHIDVVQQQVQSSYAVFGWLVLCFAVAFVPSAVHLRRNLPALRSAGYFRAQQGAPADVTKNA